MISAGANKNIVWQKGRAQADYPGSGNAPAFQSGLVQAIQRVLRRRDMTLQLRQARKGESCVGPDNFPGWAEGLNRLQMNDAGAVLAEIFDFEIAARAVMAIKFIQVAGAALEVGHGVYCGCKGVDFIGGDVGN